MSSSGAKSVSQEPQAPDPYDCAERRRLLQQRAELRHARGYVTDPSTAQQNGAEKQLKELSRALLRQRKKSVIMAKELLMEL
eukprot:7513183-Pyramimonas_sp.AAC.2